MKSINIDFNKDRSKVHVIENFTLSSAAKEQFFFKLLNRSINIEYHEIAVRNVQVPEELVIADDNQLIRLQLMADGQQLEDRSFTNFKIKSNQLVVKVLLDESQIADCHSNKTIFNGTISCTVAFVAEKNGPAEERTIAVKLTATRAQSEAGYTLTIDQEHQEGKEYRGVEQAAIGAVELQCQSAFQFAEILDRCQMSIILDDPQYQKLVSFDSNIYIEPPTLLRPEGASATVVNLFANQSLRIPVQFDFSKLVPPAAPLNITGKLVLEYIKNGMTQPRSEAFKIGVLPDTKTAALYVELKERERTRYLQSEELINENFVWKGKGTKGETSCFTFILGNRGESSPGGVSIRNLQFQFRLDPASTSVVLAPGEDLISSVARSRSLNEFFQVNEEPVDDFPDSLSLPNQIESTRELEVSFCHDTIGAIPKDVASMICKISFEFCEQLGEEEAEGEEAIYRLFESEVYFKIERSMGSHWLALDFGTSATVAAFTNGAKLTRNKEEDMLINLQDSLKKYVKNYTTAEINEKGTPFLSSEIELRSIEGEGKAMIESTAFENDIVHLSPANNGVGDENIHLKIPYLKSLIGWEHVPVIFDKINEYEYYVRDNGERFRFADRPLRVNTVLSNTYRSLFRDFIEPQIGDDEQFNKMIITVPNTFTPVHLDLIRGLITDRFRNFRKEYIHFISESDAVACNYLVNWQDFNFGRELESGHLEQEYVLVYDIGAGTTDLTYFRISKKGNKKKEVEIIGRLGKSTAGNYLDYMIAKIIDYKFNPIDKSFHYTEAGDFHRNTANDMKLLIRNNLKPRLANNEEFSIYINSQTGSATMTPNNESIEFDCSDLLDHELMTQYFKNNSDELFSQFFNLFQTIPGEDQPLSKGKVPIDTVIFTGRTIQFQKLRDHVQASIAAWSDRDVYFTPVRDSRDLKSIVVKGALQYALRFRRQQFSSVSFKNRNLLARYGVLYTDPATFEWRFKELLNPSTTPIRENPPVDGLTIFEYDTDRFNALNGEEPYIDLSATATGFFVQSFSSDTAKDANDSNWEYLTAMFDFEQDDVASGSNIERVKVRITVDARNKMRVRIGDLKSNTNTPLKMDLVENQTFKKSMWPYM
ncbi:MAG: hypothetical protein AAGG75_04185 [Bacteroidota bacterium]